MHKTVLLMSFLWLASLCWETKGDFQTTCPLLGWHWAICKNLLRFFLPDSYFVADLAWLWVNEGLAQHLWQMARPQSFPLSCCLPLPILQILPINLSFWRYRLRLQGKVKFLNTFFKPKNFCLNICWMQDTVLCAMKYVIDHTSRFTWYLLQKSLKDTFKK